MKIICTSSAFITRSIVGNGATLGHHAVRSLRFSLASLKVKQWYCDSQASTSYFRLKPVNRKYRDDIIMISGRHFYPSMLFLSKISEPERSAWRQHDVWSYLYQCMINPIKSHQDRMRNGRVISVNMLFLYVRKDPLSW